MKHLCFCLVQAVTFRSVSVCLSFSQNNICTLWFRLLYPGSLRHKGHFLHNSDQWLGHLRFCFCQSTAVQYVRHQCEILRHKLLCALQTETWQKLPVRLSCQETGQHASSLLQVVKSASFVHVTLLTNATAFCAHNADNLRPGTLG